MQLIPISLGLLEDFRKFPAPVFKLDAVPYKHASSFSRVFSISEVEYFLFVEVPVDVAKRFELCQVSEVSDEVVAISDEDLWEHDPFRKWYKFRTDKLNLDTGYHMYRLLFMSRHADDTCTLYISYVIQNNKPEQPYNYMDKYNRECNCDG